MNNRQQQKQASRQRLLNTAAQRFREQGYAATGLSEVTEGAGLTNGAFYTHFDSKQQLLEEAVRQSCEQTRDYWYGVDDSNRETAPLAWMEQLLTHYLSPEHRQLAEQGCVVPTLGAEVARQGTAVKQVFEREVGRNIDPLNKALAQLGEEGEASDWGLLALLAGGMLLSRAVAEPVLSDKILQASERVGRAYLHSLMPDGE